MSTILTRLARLEASLQEFEFEVGGIDECTMATNLSYIKDTIIEVKALEGGHKLELEDLTLDNTHLKSYSESLEDHIQWMTDREKQDE